LIQLVDQALDSVTQAIGLAVEVGGLPLVAPGRNLGADAVLAQRRPDRRLL
jgi:hypothetical protein